MFFTYPLTDVPKATRSSECYAAFLLAPARGLKPFIPYNAFLETFESQSIQFNISLCILGVYIIQALPKLQLVYFPIFRVIRDLHRFDDCLNGPGYVLHISGTALELKFRRYNRGYCC